MFKSLSEYRINQARREGKLENLEGEGKPLHIKPASDPVTSFGFSAMARAGALPKEVQLKKEIIEQRQRLLDEVDPARKREESLKLAELEMLYAIECEARRKFIG